MKIENKKLNKTCFQNFNLLKMKTVRKTINENRKKNAN